MADQYRHARIRPYGFQTDQPWSGQADRWTLMTGMICRDGKTWRKRKDVPIFTGNTNTINQDPFWGLGFNDVANGLGMGGFSTAERVVLSGAGNKLWGISPTGFADITPIGYIGSALTETPNGGVLNNIPFWTPASIGSVPHTWDGVLTNAAVPLLGAFGWPAGDACAVLASYRDFLIAGNYFDSSVGAGTWYPDQIRWSDRAPVGGLPTVWVPAATNEAGDAKLGDTPGAVVAMKPLGTALLIYKDSSVYILEEVGLPTVFNIRLLDTSFGALNPYAVQEYNGGHVVVTKGDVIFFDGQRKQSIAAPWVRKALFDTFNDPTNNLRRNEIYTAVNPEHNEVWVVYPTGVKTYANQALVWNGEVWSRFGVGSSGDQVSDTDYATGNQGYPFMFRFPVMNSSGVINDRLYAVNADAGNDGGMVRRIDGEYTGETTDDGAVFLQCEGIELEPGYVCTIQHVRPVGTDLSEGKITVGTSNDPSPVSAGFSLDAEYVWSDYDEPASRPATGRYHALRYQVTNGDGQMMTVEGFDITYTVGGRW